MAVNTVLASTAPAPAAPASTTETVELPVAPTEVRALAAVQRADRRPGPSWRRRGACRCSASTPRAGSRSACSVRSSTGAAAATGSPRPPGVAVAHGASIAVKRVVRRPRPTDPRVQVLVGTPSRLSFPSAHATSTTAAAVLFGGLLGRRLTPVLVPPMALSRLVLGVHYPTDVAAGALLGAGCRRGDTAGRRRLLPKRFSR